MILDLDNWNTARY